MYILGGHFCYISVGGHYHRNYYNYGNETSCFISHVSCTIQEDTSVIYQLEGITIENHYYYGDETSCIISQVSCTF